MSDLSQHDWEMLILACWKADKKIVDLLRWATGVLPDEKVTSVQLHEMQDAILHVYPNIGPFEPLKHHSLSVGTPVRAWIAALSKFASNALWDGEEQKALDRLRTIKRVVRRSTVLTNKEHSSAKYTQKRLEKGTKYVSARSLTKKHDWHTVK